VQPFFDSTRLKQIALYFCGAIALVVLLGWIAHKQIGVAIDWSFLIPLGGAVGVVMPIAVGITNLIQSNLSKNDERLDKLEAWMAASQLDGGRATLERDSLSRKVLKLEARFESMWEGKAQAEEIGERIGERLVEVIKDAAGKGRLG
jgi:hypothetical protein